MEVGPYRHGPWPMVGREHITIIGTTIQSSPSRRHHPGVTIQSSPVHSPPLAQALPQMAEPTSPDEPDDDYDEDDDETSKPPASTKTPCFDAGGCDRRRLASHLPLGHWGLDPDFVFDPPVGSASTPPLDRSICAGFELRSAL